MIGTTWTGGAYIPTPCIASGEFTRWLVRTGYYAPAKPKRRKMLALATRCACGGRKHYKAQMCFDCYNFYRDLDLNRVRRKRAKRTRKATCKRKH